ncbi:MAG TPA: hypothetical protein VF145_03695 [Chitinophagaceae bacterium]
MNLLNWLFGRRSGRRDNRNTQSSGNTGYSGGVTEGISAMSDPILPLAALSGMELVDTAVDASGDTPSGHEPGSTGGDNTSGYDSGGYDSSYDSGSDSSDAGDSGGDSGGGWD